MAGQAPLGSAFWWSAEIQWNAIGLMPPYFTTTCCLTQTKSHRAKPWFWIGLRDHVVSLCHRAICRATLPVGFAAHVADMSPQPPSNPWRLCAQWNHLRGVFEVVAVLHLGGWLLDAVGIGWHRLAWGEKCIWIYLDLCFSTLVLLLDPTSHSSIIHPSHDFVRHSNNDGYTNKKYVIPNTDRSTVISPSYEINEIILWSKLTRILTTA